MLSLVNDVFLVKFLIQSDYSCVQLKKPSCATSTHGVKFCGWVSGELKMASSQTYHHLSSSFLTQLGCSLKHGSSYLVGMVYNHASLKC